MVGVKSITMIFESIPELLIGNNSKIRRIPTLQDSERTIHKTYGQLGWQRGSKTFVPFYRGIEGLFLL